jgi:hypothetical protein
MNFKFYPFNHETYDRAPTPDNTIFKSRFAFIYKTVLPDLYLLSFVKAVSVFFCVVGHPFFAAEYLKILKFIPFLHKVWVTYLFKSKKIYALNIVF